MRLYLSFGVVDLLSGLLPLILKSQSMQSILCTLDPQKYTEERKKIDSLS